MESCMDKRLKQDIERMIEFINNDTDSELIKDWYIKGPPEDCGYMWCKYDTPFKKRVQQKVWSMGYESSAYGWFQRVIEDYIKNNK